LIYNILHTKDSFLSQIDKDFSDSDKGLEISHVMGQFPNYKPNTTVRVLYTNEHIYVFFRVRDRFVRCIETCTNGKVWEDSCVEFFFAPNLKYPKQYFNLEINCKGTALLHYNLIARKEFLTVPKDEINQIEIISSFANIAEPEIKTAVTWSISCKIPFTMLKKYSYFDIPKKNSEWRANFYKTASNNSNPHYISWSKIESEKPDFHRPEFFGTLKFC